MKGLSCNSGRYHSALRGYGRRIALCLLCLLVFQAFPPPARANNLWTIRSVYSGKCLEVQGASLDSGASIQQWDCGTGAHQLWYVESVNGVDYVLRNYNSGKCMDIENTSNNTGARVHQWGCYANPYQYWRGSLDSRGYQDVNTGSGKCLDLYGPTLNNGGVVVQWDCHSGANQRWTFVPA